LNAKPRTPNLPGQREATAFDVQRSMLDVRCSPTPQGWLLLDSGPCPPAFNMALDEVLLEAASRLGKPVLRFYGWTEPAATFGYFQKYAEVECATRLRPLLRRPTAGGIVPHDADWTYSLVFPPDHEWHTLRAEASYRRVHQWIQSAFTKLNVRTELAPRRETLASDSGRSRREEAPSSSVELSQSLRTSAATRQCFVGHEKSDLLWHGKKIAGAAQRRNKLGLLIQGSVQPPSASLARADWQKAMSDVGRIEMGIEWSDFDPDPALRERVESLVRQKYSQQEFITRR